VKLRMACMFGGILFLRVIGITSAPADGAPLGPVQASAEDGTWSNVPMPAGGAEVWGYEGYLSVWDPVHRRFISFNTGGGEAWILTPEPMPVWTPLHVQGSLPWRRFTAAVYDPVRDQVIVHAGENGGFTDFSDVWVLTLGATPTWSQLITYGVPPPRQDHAMIYDPVGDRVVVFGGFEHPSYFVYTYSTDTYALTLSGTPTWSKIIVAGAPPTGRRHLAACYDSFRGRMVVACGVNDGVHLNDIWALTLGAVPTWTQVTPSGVPPIGRYAPTLVYDSLADRLVLHGGFNGYQGIARNDTWTVNLSGFPVWTQVTAGGPSPPGRLSHSAAFDAVMQRMLVQAGWEWDQPEPTTWALSLGGSPSWSQVAGPPRKRTGHTTIYDPIRNRLILFGGACAAGYTNGLPLNDTWAFSLDGTMRWDLISPIGTPPEGRSGHTAIYDPIRDRMIVFGGRTTDQAVWALSFGGTPAWTQLAAQGPIPEGRRNHAAVYDPVRDRMLIMGGMYVSPIFCGYHDVPQPYYLHDVWALSLTNVPTWAKLPIDAPEVYEGHSAVYQPDSDRVVVFGGMSMTYEECEGVECCRAIATYFDRTQTLDLGGSLGWMTITPAGPGPAARTDASSVFDPIRSRMVVFGGRNPSSAMNDLWALGLGLNPSWSPLAPGGPTPGPSSDHTATYDPVQDAMWVSTIADGGGLWRLSWGVPTTVLVSLVDASPEWDRVLLAWSLGGSPGTAVSLFRNDGGNEWAERVRLESDGTGLVRFEDRDVRPSSRYGYGLRFAGHDGESILGEVWIETPGGPAVELVGARPNPPGREMLVVLQLPDRAPATLALLDVTGRVVRADDVGRLGAGRHVVSLGTTSELPSGLYFLRLHRGGGSLSAKTVIVH
jgi:hypothetical protein